MLKKVLLSVVIATSIATGATAVGPLSTPVYAAATVITLPTQFSGYSLPYSSGYSYVYDNTWITISSTGKVTTYFSATVPVKIYNASGTLVYDYIIKVGNG
ncbi:hypothetical protein QVE09_19235 [Paenibacillus sp. ClWae2A]|uniref:hypothetical protein n=1 Tax=unclassified Paenibacillus TaxID=185978 RepID=UPI0028F5E014|nr:hypothetical protein [Paenibacillus sp. ClWae2A]MDT9721039.1 hypothetical protein [Paenibacillus sp. ClWae2A]